MIIPEAMHPKIGLFGFGRIGFCIARLRYQHIVAIAVKRSPKKIARKFKYDSTHGTFPGEVTWTKDEIIIDGHHIKIVNTRDPKKVRWDELGAEYVIDCTGKFGTQEKAHVHIDSGAEKVILSYPSKDDRIPMFVYGVNHTAYEPTMRIVSNASCTTNCLAPLAKVLQDEFGIKSGLMTTIHAATSKQRTVDMITEDVDEEPAGEAFEGETTDCSVFDNIIISTTGAAKAVGKVIPSLKGKLTGISVRVPVKNVSLVDLSVNLEKPATYKEVCAAIKKASETTMKGVIAYYDFPMVSSFFNGDTCTCNFVSLLEKPKDKSSGNYLPNDPHFVKLEAYYDNEMGYSAKLLCVVDHMYEVDHLSA